MPDVLIPILIVLYIPLWAGLVGVIALNVNYIVEELILEWRWRHDWDDALH